MDSTQQENTAKTILRGTAVVGVLTLLSRLLGFGWNLVLALFFGAGAITDTFFVAFRIPNLFRSLVAEGALTSAFVPVFARELQRGHAEAQTALSSVLTLLLILTSALAAIGMFWTRELVLLIAPGFNDTPKQLELCITMTRIMFPYLIFVSLTALINGTLNSVKIFGAAPLAQITMNVTLIIGTIIAGLVFQAEQAVLILAIVVVMGGILQVLIQRPGLQRAKFQLTLGKCLLTPVTRRVLMLLGPAALGAAVYQVNIFLATLLASLLPAGSVSWLFYADRLAQLPIGVFTIALASVLLPTLSQAAAAGKDSEFATRLVDALRYTSFIIIPISVLFYVLAEPIVTLLFERGAFQAYDTQATAIAVKALCFGLWGISCNSLMMRAFMARQDTVTPTIVGAIGVALSLLISLALMGQPAIDRAQYAPTSLIWLQQLLAIADLRHAGLALASGLSSTITIVVLMLLLDRANVRCNWKIFLVATLQTTIASLIAGWAAGSIIQNSTPWIALAMASLVGVPIFISTAWLTGSHEAREVVKITTRYYKHIFKSH